MRPEDETARATAHDHARAGERGERLLTLTNAIVSALVGSGIHVYHAPQARRLIFHVLADDIYGNRAIDLPEDL